VSTETPPLRDDCFELPRGVAWVPVDEALGRLRDTLAPVAGTEDVAVARAGGRILAAPLVARRANPPAANTAVDGYGFAHDTLGTGPHTLPVEEGRAAAGTPFEGAVAAGHAVRILTGALLPAGVDTVVLDEDTAREGDTVRFERVPKLGANTRTAGEDVAPGTEVLPTGHRLRPQDLALAAAVGLAELPVRRRLRVAVLSTGDEIRPAGAAAAPHQTYDANRPMLLDILRRWEMQPVDLGHVPDDPSAVAAALDRGAAEADAVLTSGGASAGDEDHVADVLRARGALAVWRIAVKPGRPLALGVWGGKPVFGLPGNPVAAFVCTLVFARPALLRLAGTPWELPRGLMLPAGFAKTKKAGRREYLRARIGEDGRVEVFKSEGSGRISGLAWARGLVELDDGPRDVSPGDPVRYLPFPDFGL
jgi:molybdopterin molybdotransferase